ncbi:MAG: RNA 2',3'-cyclic phosphodiesterase [Bacillota bacterium]
MKKLRLFWAVNLPGELKAKLAAVVDRLGGCGADAKWVERDNLHVTVKFLGDVDTGRVEEITGTVSRGLKYFPAFRLDLGGPGFFPGPASPRVFWVGLSGGAGSLAEMAGIVDDVMGGLGFAREGRKFSPHLTLARIRSPRNIKELAGAVASLKDVFGEMGGFNVSSLDLMQSDLTRSGPVYSKLASVELVSRV